MVMSYYSLVFLYVLRFKMKLLHGFPIFSSRAYQVCSNDDATGRLTLTYLTSRSNLIPNAFKWDFFFKFFFLKTGSLSDYSHLLCLT